MAKITALVSLLLVVLLGVTATAAAGADASEWSEVNIPAAGSGGGWVLAPGSDITQLSLGADGVLHAVMTQEGSQRLMRSGDGGQSWTETGYAGEVVDIVGADAGSLYLTDGSRVYKSADGGEGFRALTPPDLDGNEIISCLDIGYDGYNHPLVFIGTADGDGGQWGSVYYLEEGGVRGGVGGYDGRGL